MNEAIREMFLTDWVRECATEQEIVEKLIEHDERAKEIMRLKRRITELEEINKQHQELNSELRKENEELKEYKENATRKHWQQKCAEHCINEKLLQIRIDKAIEYIESNDNSELGIYQTEFLGKQDLLNILQDKEEV